MITSAKNEKIKEVAELIKKPRARDKAGLFVVEGVRMVAELPAERAVKIYVSESRLAACGADPERCEGIAGIPAGVPCEAVSDAAFSAMSDTRTPQGVLALARQYTYTSDDVLGDHGARPPLLMILENIQDPGNLGTILRAAEGAGVSGVVMNRGTVDIYNPKVIRSTMGSVFRVPFFYADDFGGTLSELKRRGIRLFAAHLEGARDYDREDYKGGSAFLIGNEGNGLTAETAAAADATVRIPMAGKVESLNAAMAASILMFEAARQRRL